MNASGWSSCFWLLARLIQGNVGFGLNWRELHILYDYIQQLRLAH